MAKKKLNAFEMAQQAFQRLSQGAGNIVGGLTRQPMVSPLPQRQPIKLQDNFLSQVGRSPVGQSITGVQRFLESPKSINLPNVPQQINPTFNVGISNTRFQVPIQPVQFARDIVNTPVSYAANALSDIAVNTGRTIRGDQLLNYNQVKSPATRLGYNISQQFNPISTQGYGVNNNAQNIIGNVAGTALGPLSVYGGGKILGLGGKAAAPEIQSFFQALMSSAASGGKIGGIYGLLNGLAEGKDKKLIDQLTMGLQQGTIGTVFGGLLGGGIGGGGYAFQKIFNPTLAAVKKVRPELSNKEAIVESGKYLRRTGGQFAGLSKNQPFKAAGGKMVDPKQPPKVNDWMNQVDKELGLDTINTRGGYIKFGEEVGGKPSVANPPLSDIKTAIEQPKPVVQASAPLQEAPKSGTSPTEFRQGVGNIPPGSSSEGSIPPPSDPVNKIIQALKEAKPIRKEQEALYSADRARRVAQAAAVGQKIGGEQGYYAQLGSLKGELRKAQFEGIREKLTPDDVNKVFQMVEDVPYFSTFEKVTAKTGLAKLLGKEGGVVPNNSELKLLNEIFPPEFIKAAQGNKSLLQKLMGTIGDVVAVPRSLMAGGLDMSYGLRQGVFSGYRHPRQWASAFKEQFKYFGSEKALKEASEQIQAHPNYKLAREAGLAMTDLKHGKLSPGEEQFQSALAEKIPGIGRLVRASGRAYTGFANKYRFDIFNDLVAQAKKTGDFDDPRFLKSAGELVNTLTGRGNLGPLEKSAGVLSTTLFSPRLLASRLQLMNPQFYIKLQPMARRRAIESLVAYAAGTATILGAAKLAGADVGTDPTNSDFAKIKIGNTRVDIMGGFQQPMVLLSRLITGRLTSSTTGKTMILGEGYKAANRFDIIQRFFESKEAPIISFITSAIKGKDAVGKDFNLSTEVINRMVPMFISDMVELYKDGGLSSMPLAIPAFFGTGNQTYGKTELVTGKNQLGEPTSQVRPIQGLGETVTEAVFGQQTLGSSSTTNVQSYYDQMLKMPQGEAAAEFDKISQTNPDLAKKILQVHKDRQMGVTVDDQVIKAKGVASGDRAISIANEFKKLKTNEEKAALWEHYVKVKVITKDVAEQLGPLLTR